MVTGASIIALYAGIATATIHVPGDFALIQDAIEAGGDGDTALVAPGEYQVEQSVRFGDVAVEVRAEEGSETTAIVLSQLPDVPHNAVVIFEGTTAAECVLAGFTVTATVAIDPSRQNTYPRISILHPN